MNAISRRWLNVCIVILVAMTTLPGPATPLRFWNGWISVVDRGWQTAIRCLMLAFILQRVWLQRSASTSESALSNVLRPAPH